MIFVTVGTQGPFDRMVRAIDDWAARNRRKDVFAQIGRDARRPTAIDWVEQLDAVEFKRRVQEAEVVIAHAGMGTVLTALELGKPVLIMPRRASLGEHRNDHQLSTVRKLAALGLATVAQDECELDGWLQELDQVRVGKRDRSQELDKLIQKLRAFLTSGAS